MWPPWPHIVLNDPGTDSGLISAGYVSYSGNRRLALVARENSSSRRMIKFSLKMAKSIASAARIRLTVGHGRAAGKVAGPGYGTPLRT